MEKTNREQCIDYMNKFKTTQVNETALDEIKALLEYANQSEQNSCWYRTLCDFILLVKNGETSSQPIQDSYRHFSHVSLSIYWKEYDDYNQVAGYITKSNVRLTLRMGVDANYKKEFLDLVVRKFKSILISLEIKHFSSDHFGQLISKLKEKFGDKKKLNYFSGKGKVTKQYTKKYYQIIINDSKAYPEFYKDVLKSRLDMLITSLGKDQNNDKEKDTSSDVIKLLKQENPEMISPLNKDQINQKEKEKDTCSEKNILATLGKPETISSLNKDLINQKEKDACSESIIVATKEKPEAIYSLEIDQINEKERHTCSENIILATKEKPEAISSLRKDLIIDENIDKTFSDQISKHQKHKEELPEKNYISNNSSNINMGKNVFGLLGEKTEPNYENPNNSGLINDKNQSMESQSHHVGITLPQGHTNQLNKDNLDEENKKQGQGECNQQGEIFQDPYKSSIDTIMATTTQLIQKQLSELTVNFTAKLNESDQKNQKCVVELKDAIVGLAADNQELKTRVVVLETNNQELKNDNQELKKDIQELKKDNQELKARVVVLETDNIKLKLFFNSAINRKVIVLLIKEIIKKNLSNVGLYYVNDKKETSNARLCLVQEEMEIKRLGKDEFKLIVKNEEFEKMIKDMYDIKDEGNKIVHLVERKDIDLKDQVIRNEIDNDLFNKLVPVINEEIISIADKDKEPLGKFIADNIGKIYKIEELKLRKEEYEKKKAEEKKKKEEEEEKSI